MPDEEPRFVNKNAAHRSVTNIQGVTLIMYGKHKYCVLSLKPSHTHSNLRIISAIGGGGCNTVTAKKRVVYAF
jgi:hypothetical protein